MHVGILKEIKSDENRVALNPEGSRSCGKTDIRCWSRKVPGAVPKTSTRALTNVTLPYAVEMANKGLEKAIKF